MCTMSRQALQTILTMNLTTMIFEFENESIDSEDSSDDESEVDCDDDIDNQV